MRSLRELIMGLGRHGSGGLGRQDCTVSGSGSPTMKHGKVRIEVLDAVNGRVALGATFNPMQMGRSLNVYESDDTARQKQRD